MECKMMHNNAIKASSSSLESRGCGHKTDDVLDDVTPNVDYPELQTKEKEILDTITETPEAVTEIDDGAERDIICECQTEDHMNSKVGSSEKGASRSHDCSKVLSSSDTDSNSSYRQPSTSAILPDSEIDQEDSSSVDEGIQTSPPFETDDPWEHITEYQGINPAADTPTTRRFSMTAALLRSPPGRSEEDAGENGVTLRSPTKSWLADDVKARRWRYRPKSCSLPHIDWLKQRTETALDRSAEMQRRTAELLQSAKAIRDLEV